MNRDSHHRWIPRISDFDLTFITKPVSSGEITRFLSRFWLDLYPLESLAIISNSKILTGKKENIAKIPSLRAIEKSAAVQYGVWLINRNDWVKENSSQRTALFQGMILQAQTYVSALSKGQLGSTLRESSDLQKASLAQIYDLSSRVLEELKEAILLYRHKKQRI